MTVNNEVVSAFYKNVIISTNVRIVTITSFQCSKLRCTRTELGHGLPLFTSCREEEFSETRSTGHINRSHTYSGKCIFAPAPCCSYAFTARGCPRTGGGRGRSSPPPAHKQLYSYRPSGADLREACEVAVSRPDSKGLARRSYKEKPATEGGSIAGQSRQCTDKYGFAKVALIHLVELLEDRCLLEPLPLGVSPLRHQGASGSPLSTVSINNTVKSGLQDEAMLRSARLKLYLIFHLNRLIYRKKSRNVRQISTLGSATQPALTPYFAAERI